jgi:hypothetical protein
MPYTINSLPTGLLYVLWHVNFCRPTEGAGSCIAVKQNTMLLILIWQFVVLIYLGISQRNVSAAKSVNWGYLKTA